jgi:dimethylamine/trimethylamine dehydrogenase
MVLGKRGMRRVHLVDADSELGGNLRWTAELPGLGQWARVVNWRRIQLDRLANVEFVPRTRLDAAAVREYGAELVVVATGSRWAADGLNGVTRGPIPGAGLPHVLTPEQVVAEGRRLAGERVVVYDAEGYVVGSCVAEQLALDGHRVELVTPHSLVAPVTDETLEGSFYRQRLHEVGVTPHRDTYLTAIEPGRVVGVGPFEEPCELEADAVVLVTQRVSDESLYLDLVADRDALAANGIEAVYRIGDCVAPRTLSAVVFDGHRLAREIDSEDPAIPKPYLREGWADVETRSVEGARITEPV